MSRRRDDSTTFHDLKYRWKHAVRLNRGLLRIKNEGQILLRCSSYFIIKHNLLCVSLLLSKSKLLVIRFICFSNSNLFFLRSSCARNSRSSYCLIFCTPISLQKFEKTTSSTLFILNFISSICCSRICILFSMASIWGPYFFISSFNRVNSLSTVWICFVWNHF